MLCLFVCLFFNEFDTPTYMVGYNTPIGLFDDTGACGRSWCFQEDAAGGTVEGIRVSSRTTPPTYHTAGCCTRGLKIHIPPVTLALALASKTNSGWSADSVMCVPLLECVGSPWSRTSRRTWRHSGFCVYIRRMRTVKTLERGRCLPCRVPAANKHTDVSKCRN